MTVPLILARPAGLMPMAAGSSIDATEAPARPVETGPDPGSTRPPACAAAGERRSSAATALRGALIWRRMYVGGTPPRQGEMGHQDRHRRRGDPGHPRGLAHRAGTQRRQLLDHLAGQAGD